MKLWRDRFLSLGTLIILLYHFLFPHIAFASSQKDTFIRFPYDKDLQDKYAALIAEEEAGRERILLLERLKKIANVRYHIITAYSSTVWQTDSSPFITAAGTVVREGVVAANTLPFGTKIMMPDLFGDKIFTVEDRMAPKNYHKIDVWFPSTYNARWFGVKRARVLVIPQGVDTRALEHPSA